MNQYSHVVIYYENKLKTLSDKFREEYKSNVNYPLLQSIRDVRYKKDVLLGFPHLELTYKESETEFKNGIKDFL